MQANTLFKHIVSRTVARRSYGHNLKVTYNDLPTPQGNWKTQYDAYQRKYNAQLAFGIFFAVGTIVFAKGAGFLYLNYTPPSKPAE